MTETLDRASHRDLPDRGSGSPIIGVLGGSGGVGASSFAAVLALVGAAVLIDLDATGGGLDVLLGIETVPGARWSGLRVAGGTLEPEALAAGLPRAGPCSVLAADVAEVEVPAVLQVLDTAAALGPVVLDLPRADGPVRAAVLPHCDLVVALVRADLGGLVGAHAVLGTLPEVPLGVIVRRGPVAAAEAAQLVGAALLGALPALGAGRLVLDPARLPRRSAKLAGGVWAGCRV